jgi:hypothetical protein
MNLNSAGRIALFLVGILYEGCSIGGPTTLGEAGNTAQGIGRHMCRIIEFDAGFAHRRVRAGYRLFRTGGNTRGRARPGADYR